MSNTVIDTIAAVAIEPDRDPDGWASYCREAQGLAIAGVIEYGRRIEEAHRAYKLEPQRWGRTWESWCQEGLGITGRHARKLMMITRELGLTKTEVLPSATDSLYSLAQLRNRNPDAFNHAVEAGDIRPDMGRGQVQLLVTKHSRPQREQAQVRDIEAVPGSGWRLGEHLLFCADSSTWRPPLDAPARMAFADPPYGLTSASWDAAFYWDHDWLQDAADLVFVTPGTRNAKTFQPQMRFHWQLAFRVTNGMSHGPVGFANVIFVELYSRLDSVRVGQSDFGEGAIAVSQNRQHQGQKPTSLLVWLMETFTDPGDWVIDPFLGSGTTLLAAEQTGRRCVGAEINPDYCRQIVAAWEQQTGKTAESIT